MDLQYIRRLFKALQDYQISEFELEEEGTRLHIFRGEEGQEVRPYNYTIDQPFPPNPASPQEATSNISDVQRSADVLPQRTSPTEHVEKQYQSVLSPIVGIFYRAPTPDADPFVRVGQQIEVGTQLCIIEAMKLMNVIESDVSGKVIEILIQNGKPVEYNQPLFLIDPA